MDKTTKELIKGVHVEILHSTPIKEGSEAWRIVVDYKSDIPEPNKLIKSYYIWVTGEYLEDIAKLSANISSAEEFAIDVAQRRFLESNNQVPVENGLAFSNKGGEEVVDPRDYTHPFEQV
ncbi:MAG: hypothetical protein UV68_C0046G0001 [Candidatus Collierbacteria bacterium GW2011_GWC2_43_12]|uniref:Uncharacterized protein n=1 Tax=Candidatus Collierbacteria bacterium GW2011_GWC2_43_12 TaxID=1618390 RepID=A0A0G1D3W5_9BACT|nr:MAG: hypothetical protein UV68_C0046G0001 [Candidatus Collierbacteria bacterium GW2011_GWC2_43_12]